MVVCFRDWPRLTHKVSLEHFSSKPDFEKKFCLVNMHKWVCFQSNQEGHPAPPTTPLLRTFELWPPGVIPGDDESLYAKLGDCHANVLFFISVCYLGTHYLLDFLSWGGSKQLYLPNPSVNTDTPLHHTHTHTRSAPKNLVANSRESHDDYQQFFCLVCSQHWERV